MDSSAFPPSPEIQQAILNAIFNLENHPKNVELQSTSDSYFCYYKKTVEKSRAQNNCKTHGEVANLVGLLKSTSATRTSVESALRIQLGVDGEGHNETIDDLINLAVRLLLMLSTGGFLSYGRSITVSGETRLSWKEGTVQDLVNTQFIPQKTMRENVKLERIFNARNLERIAGIEIRWTSNLADHLVMRDDDTAVEVFHYASFLRFHQTSEYGRQSQQSLHQLTFSRSIFPSAFHSQTPESAFSYSVLILVPYSTTKL
jgi:hypothetical protein